MNTELVKGFFAGFLFAVSFSVSAQDYPAADFQPKVLYRDPSITEVVPATTSGVAASNTNVPCIQKQEAPEVDAKYPAANFQPKVVFSATGS